MSSIIDAVMVAIRKINGVQQQKQQQQTYTTSLMQAGKFISQTPYQIARYSRAQIKAQIDTYYKFLLTLPSTDKDVAMVKALYQRAYKQMGEAPPGKNDDNQGTKKSLPQKKKQILTAMLEAKKSGDLEALKIDRDANIAFDVKEQKIATRIEFVAPTLIKTNYSNVFIHGSIRAKTQIQSDILLPLIMEKHQAPRGVLVTGVDNTPRADLVYNIPAAFAKIRQFNDRKVQIRMYRVDSEYFYDRHDDVIVDRLKLLLKYMHEVGVQLTEASQKHSYVFIVFDTIDRVTGHQADIKVRNILQKHMGDSPHVIPVILGRVNFAPSIVRKCTVVVAVDLPTVETMQGVLFRDIVGGIAADTKAPGEDFSCSNFEFKSVCQDIHRTSLKIAKKCGFRDVNVLQGHKEAEDAHKGVDAQFQYGCTIVDIKDFAAKVNEVFYQHILANVSADEQKCVLMKGEACRICSNKDKKIIQNQDTLLGEIYAEKQTCSAANNYCTECQGETGARDIVTWENLKKLNVTKIMEKTFNTHGRTTVVEKTYEMFAKNYAYPSNTQKK